MRRAMRTALLGGVAILPAARPSAARAQTVEYGTRPWAPWLPPGSSDRARDTATSLPTAEPATAAPPTFARVRPWPAGAQAPSTRSAGAAPRAARVHSEADGDRRSCVRTIAVGGIIGAVSAVGIVAATYTFLRGSPSGKTVLQTGALGAAYGAAVGAGVCVYERIRHPRE